MPGESHGQRYLAGYSPLGHKRHNLVTKPSPPSCWRDHREWLVEREAEAMGQGVGVGMYDVVVVVVTQPSQGPKEPSIRL